ncbi:MAG: nuclear transport factor 2 family protein [Burkholderiales bacterium]|nr:nuclear transport factor 2 family protein [Burkholderiales bacterium]
MPDGAGNEIQVRNLIERWVEAVCRGDMQGVLADHSPDIVMYDVPEPIQCKGLRAYRQTWELFFAENGIGPDCFRLLDLEIHAGADMAFAYGLLAISSATAGCRLTIGLRRTGRTWTVVHEHHSMAMP